MKRNLFLLLMLVLLIGGLSMVAAQDTMDAVNLVVWSQDGAENDVALAAVFETWAAEFAPGSTLEIVSKDVEIQRNDVLTAGLAGSGLPDFLLSPNDSIGVWEDAGLVLPLDELFDMSVYTNASATELEGTIYGVPHSAGNHLMLMYNKSLVETPPDTWEDLVAAAHAVEEANPDVQGFAYNLTDVYWLVAWVGGFGGGVFDDEGNFALESEAWVNAFQFVHDLKFVEEIVPTECDYNCASDTFKEGTTAMILNGDWAVGEYLDTEKSPALGEENLGLAPWPALSNGERPKPFVAGKFYSIPVTTEGAQLDATVAFLTWVSTNPDAVSEYVLGTSRLPAVVGFEIEDPVLAASAAAMATGTGFPPEPALRCMWDSVKAQLEGVMNDSVTPEDAALESQISAEECLEG